MDNATLALTRQRQLLTMEYEAEKKAFAEITDRIGITRLAERGNAWTDIRVTRSFYNSLNNRILEFTRPDDSDPDHNFEYGKPVAFFIADPTPGTSPRILFNGTVSIVDGNRMAVIIPDSADITMLQTADAGSAGVMLSFDETSYRTMFDALSYTARAKGRLAELRDLFYSRRKAARLAFSPLRFPYLNDSQQHAVNEALMAKDVAIVHGPPGTGKTTTLVETIHETLRREPQVLVCAQSNMAVDWICEQLTDRGINVLRLGNPSRVNDKMLAHTYERRFEAHPDYPTLWSIRKTLREVYSQKGRSETRHQKIERLKSRADELEIRIRTDLFGEARVIASTLVGSANRLLDGMKFSTLFIDEAAQALEAASWIPIRRAGRVIFAGDHCQLPPTVKDFEAMKQGLGVSLMERIAENHPEAVSLLTRQYRMHEDIMKFSSDWFYGGKMVADESVRHRGILDLDTPAEWIDTAGIIRQAADSSEAGTNAQEPAAPSADDYREQLSGHSYGRVNPAEARLTIDTLKEYIEKIGISRFLSERLDIGIISPYRAQVKYLRRLVSRDSYFKRLRHLISIDTVDGFQGQERDIIIVSLVRSNDEGNIGFLRDLRRMNVAITRARMKLILIGDSATLACTPFYRRLYRYIRSLAPETSLPEGIHEQIAPESEEKHREDDHLGHVLEGMDPDLLE